jgi:hypothetical protein
MKPPGFLAFAKQGIVVVETHNTVWLLGEKSPLKTIRVDC